MGSLVSPWGALVGWEEVVPCCSVGWLAVAGAHMHGSQALFVSVIIAVGLIGSGLIGFGLIESGLFWVG